MTLLIISVTNRLPQQLCIPFHYESQQDRLCAKHAINNVMAIKDFVAIQDLDDIVASPRNTFALKQGRHIGYCTSTVMDFLLYMHVPVLEGTYRDTCTTVPVL